MNIPSANLMENPVKSQKSKSYHKAKGMSCFAFLFSVGIYVSAFYIFSLSPSALFSNSKFWFVISNTLILIIAADYGAFSSSKEKFDLHEEYALHNQARSAAASFVVQYPDIAKKSIDIPREEENIMMSSEGKKVENHDTLADQKNEITAHEPERTLQVVQCEPPEEYPSDNFQAKGQLQERIEHDHEQPMKLASNKTKVEPKRIQRSKSHNVERVTFYDKKHVLRRSETEKLEDDESSSNDSDDSDSSAEQENEFSKMSNEELNRRVEEFIQNFKGQIRHQIPRKRPLLICE